MVVATATLGPATLTTEITLSVSRFVSLALSAQLYPTPSSGVVASDGRIRRIHCTDEWQQLQLVLTATLSGCHAGAHTVALSATGVTLSAAASVMSSTPSRSSSCSEGQSLAAARTRIFPRSW